MNKKSLSRALIALAVGAALSACVTAPAPRSRAASAPPLPPVQATKVYFYPLQGQNEAQQDRDRYECFSWATRQTGFDPSRHAAPEEQRAAVVPARSPGQAIGAAAAVGAVIGAIAGGPGNTAEGAVVGAMAGTVLGSAAAASEQSNAQQVSRYRDSRRDTRFDQQAAEFRRAMSACLEGRGYSVK
jgi:pectin methylesterase-like acyl-CoA thioesterase